MAPRPGQVTGQVIGKGLIVSGIGTAAGVMLALVTTRALRAVLYGVAVPDPFILAAVAAVLLSAVLIASYIPARHAARIDPVWALRGD